VIIGGHNITNSGLGTNAIRRSVIKILKHESFVKYQAFDFDIALLKLDVIIISIYFFELNAIK